MYPISLFKLDFRKSHRRVQRGGGSGGPGPDPPFPGHPTPPPLSSVNPPSHPTRSHRQM